MFGKLRMFLGVSATASMAAHETEAKMESEGDVCYSHVTREEAMRKRKARKAQKAAKKARRRNRQ